MTCRYLNAVWIAGLVLGFFTVTIRVSWPPWWPHRQPAQAEMTPVVMFTEITDLSRHSFEIFCQGNRLQLADMDSSVRLESPEWVEETDYSTGIRWRYQCMEGHLWQRLVW